MLYALVAITFFICAAILWIRPATVAAYSLLIVLAGIWAFCLYFFRNPVRQVPSYDQQTLISPADGQVLEVSTNSTAQENMPVKIVIFLSPLDVHVNWIPCDGVIEKTEYRPGKFLVAWAPKCSDINERFDIWLRTARNEQVLVRQIAGFVARRIIVWAHEHETVQRGHKYGMIRFGSRVDLYLPAHALPLVKVGQRVSGGIDAIAQFNEARI